MEDTSTGWMERMRERLAVAHRTFHANVRAGRDFVAKRRTRRLAVRQPIRWVPFVAVCVPTILLVALVLDMPVGNYHGHWPLSVEKLARDVTDIGKSGWILVPTGVAILLAHSLDWQFWGVRGRVFLVKWLSVLGFIFFSIAGGGTVAAIVKRIVGRARPTHFHDLGAFSFHPFADATFASFPSGHSTTVGGLFMALALLFPRLRLPFLVLALWLAFTRVLVEAHYPSDVVAGLALGAWFSYFSAMLFARHGLIFTCDASGWPVRRSGFRPVRLGRRQRSARRHRSSADAAN